MSTAADGSLRNVELDGRDVGGQSVDDLAGAVAEMATAFGRTAVAIRSGSRTLESTAGEMGLVLDSAATVAAVLDAGRDDPLLARPMAWARSFRSPVTVSSTYRVRSDQLALALVALDGEAARQAVEPAIVASAVGVRVQPGQPGLALDLRLVEARLLDAARAGEDPITIDVSAEETAPWISDEDAQQVAERVTAITSTPFVVTVAGKQATFGPVELRSWVGAQPTRDGFQIVFDGEAIAAALNDRIVSLGEVEPKDASFTLDGTGAVRITPAIVGWACCGDDAPRKVADALREGQASVELDPITQEPDLTTEEAEALGIKEPVGTTTDWNGQRQVKSFTTYYAAGEPRVTNLQRIADLVRGAVVLPGETFSINERVGPRTAEKGFVEAGAISNGEHVTEVGGGVSQFATTTFNAAYFAGLPFEEYQAHSEYFSRYPRGREATMGYPAPDLKFTNDTPYGIMIWTSYTDTSITVTLYSTQYGYGQQTAQSEARTAPACTTVTTERTITYPDGRTATDEFRATYRDTGIRTCNG